jgi:hypothetical protein
MGRWSRFLTMQHPAAAWAPHAGAGARYAACERVSAEAACETLHKAFPLHRGCGCRRHSDPG